MKKKTIIILIIIIAIVAGAFWFYVNLKNKKADSSEISAADALATIKNS